MCTTPERRRGRRSCARTRPTGSGARRPENSRATRSGRSASPGRRRSWSAPGARSGPRSRPPTPRLRRAPAPTWAVGRTTLSRTSGAASASSTTWWRRPGLRDRGKLRRVLVVDLDVHQGDGTHAAFAQDDEAFTFALNGLRQLPVPPRGGRSRARSPPGRATTPTWTRSAALLPEAIGRARAELCFYLAGADPFAGDRLGRLALTHGGLRAATASCARSCCAPGFPCA